MLTRSAGSWHHGSPRDVEAVDSVANQVAEPQVDGFCCTLAVDFASIGRFIGCLIET